MSKLFTAAIVVIGGLLLSSCNLFFPSRRGEVAESWITTNNTFKIRVDKHSEKNGGFVAGAYYVFQSAKEGQENWTEIIVSRHDDPIDIPRQQVRFVKDQVGYLFMNYKFAVTTDAGTTWFTWDAVKDLSDWKSSRATIKEVHIELNGAGVMEFNSFTNQAAPTLYTEDFGRTWRFK